MEFWASILTLTFDKNRMAQLSALGASRNFATSDISWYSPLPLAEWD